MVGLFFDIQHPTSSLKNLFLSKIPYFVNKKAFCLTKVNQFLCSLYILLGDAFSGANYLP